MFESILLPVDGSKYSDKAAEKALNLVKELDRDIDITVLNVIVKESVLLHNLYYQETEEFSKLTKVSSEMEEKSKEILDRYKEIAEGMGVNVKTKSVVGSDAANAIIEEAEEMDFSHIIMGSKGRTGLSRVVLGSVAEKVIRNASCPVTVVR